MIASALRRILASTLGCALLFNALPAQAGGHTGAWNSLSTALAVGLPLTAVAQTWSADDQQGMLQLSVSLGGTLLATEALKRAHPEMRPDGSGNDSFPSGHSAIAFAAARYLDQRYAPSGAPIFYGLAGLTAVARVEANKHYWRDVVAGGALGWGIASLSTTRYGVIGVAPTQGGLAFWWQQLW